MGRDPGIARFNKIYILQSLDEAERQTGDEIYSVIKYSSLKYPIFHTLVHLNSSRDLFSALQNIKLQTTQEKVIPYILGWEDKKLETVKKYFTHEISATPSIMNENEEIFKEI